MSVARYRLQRGRYHDSVVLMQLQRGLAELPGVEEAGVMMATAANQELLAAGGLLPGPLPEARPDDLLVAVRAATDKAAGAALDRFAELAGARRAAAASDYRPKSLEAALRQMPEARWVLISVPGRHAAEVARRSLAAGRNVFLYSDNVSVEAEVELKHAAAAAGLLVLGPDCGTAVLGGVGLGFANRVRRGPIGLVGASGTGLQTIAARVHALGSGVSHSLGTGGRDLSAAVGGATALRALAALAADPATGVLVVVSKPPDDAVARRLLRRAHALPKPVVLQFQGFVPPGRRLGNLRFASDLEDAAALAVELAADPATAPALGAGRGGAVRGLFSGGTLAGEALLRLASVLSPIATNVSGHRAQKLAAARAPEGHAVLDLGADELTVGRPHPMIDPRPVAEHVERAAADGTVGAVLLDVVLGDGAHADPASVLAPAIAKARRTRGALAVHVVIVGTDEDPQDLASQIERLEKAGATVHDTLGGAVDAALAGLPADGEPSAPFSLETPPAVVNVGLELFHDSLVAQGASSVQVDWRPPAGGNEKLAAILERLR
jgi:FdrA protein